MEQILLLLVLPTIIIFLIQRRKIFRKSLEPPGPPGLPFIGNLLQFNSITSRHQYFWQLSKKYGPLMSMRFGSRRVLIVSSARIAKEALTTHDLAFSGRPQTLVLQKLSYNGLDFAFTPYSEYWRETRKLLVLNVLNLRKVQSFSPVREDEVYHMIQKIAKLAASSKSVNLSEVSMTITFTIICRVGFGKRFGKVLEIERLKQLFHEVQAMFAANFYSDFFPSLSWIDRISGKIGRLEKNFQDFDSFYQEILDEHLNQDRSKSSEEDMVDILLKLRDEKSFPFDLTLNHIKAVLMNVLLGATDTGSSIIVWAMTALLENSMIMEKVQAEIRQLGKKRMITEDDIPKLPYFKAFIKETLRFYPPTPLLVPRGTREKCNIDGYEIQPKTIVYFNAWGIARDPEHWKNPEEFRPERFLGSCVDYKGQDFEFIPFGAGRRGCPGISLGMATVELALANLLYSFDWELPFGMKIEDIGKDVLPGLTLQRKNELCLLAKNYV
ncbi:hypothetical protein ACH5RR_000717 [Cinchona calisaya]|uniref:Cytochrome P450 n=1 Tax=Cinchona calisaya TaxID=153742 RepID=A0ABD3B1Y0_9GENT